MSTHDPSLEEVKAVAKGYHDLAVGLLKLARSVHREAELRDRVIDLAKNWLTKKRRKDAIETLNAVEPITSFNHLDVPALPEWRTES